MKNIVQFGKLQVESILRGSDDLDELVPGDDPVIVEVKPPEGQLYPVQLVGVDRGLFTAAEQSGACLISNIYINPKIMRSWSLQVRFSIGINPTFFL